LRQATPRKAETTLLEPFVGLTLSQIVVPVTAAEFAEAAKNILAAGVVGFDTESKPTFTKGEVSTGPHIVQSSRHLPFGKLDLVLSLIGSRCGIS
jgi:hypothetical protein